MDDSKIYLGVRGYGAELLSRRPGQKFSFVLAFLSAALYSQVAFLTNRNDSVILLSCYVVLFIAYLLLTRSVFSFKYLLGLGILFRLIFLFSVPNLSDDFYRFFWDGILTNHQINPFLYLPSEIMENPLIRIPELDSDLFLSLNSPNYYTVYPPFSQFVFFLAAKPADGDIRIAVFIMKAFILAAEVGTIILIPKLLKKNNLKREYVYFYILNPLIIIELVGNIHFEAFLIFFVLLSIYLLEKNRLLSAAVFFALAVSAKLTPMLLLPLFLKRLKFKKVLIFYILSLLIVTITFLPFFGSALINGLSSSIGLYFNKFEFNASIFYIVREIGFWVKGWDIIQSASNWLAACTAFLIVIISLLYDSKRQNLPGVFIWPFFIYFALASIIHPWYIAPLVAFGIFSGYMFPVLWSFTIFLSYTGYSTDGFQEHWWVLFAEYIPVYALMIYELRKRKSLISLRNPLTEIL